MLLLCVRSRSEIIVEKHSLCSFEWFNIDIAFQVETKVEALANGKIVALKLPSDVSGWEHLSIIRMTFSSSSHACIESWCILWFPSFTLISRQLSLRTYKVFCRNSHCTRSKWEKHFTSSGLVLYLLSRHFRWKAVWNGKLHFIQAHSLLGGFVWMQYIKGLNTLTISLIS